MNRNNPPARPSKKSRCVICNRPDRDVIDSDLTLGLRSQVEVAEFVDVHPSTVCRHFGRHAQPRIAMMVAGTTDIPTGNLVAEHEWLYEISREVLVRALEDDDRRLTRDMTGECRKQLVEMRELKQAVEAGKIGDADGQASDSEARMAADLEEMDNLREDIRRTREITEMVEAAVGGADPEELHRHYLEDNRPPDPLPSDTAGETD
jgi:hypothetical protein